LKKVIVIFGPTGVGKTKLSIELAQRLNGEIVSADSMQIYRGMNIGTAKIIGEEMQGIPHHMLDLVSPKQEYSVGEYVKEAKKIILDILLRGKIPIIVGGTGLYINSLVNDYDFHDASKNEKIREKYKKIAQEKGAEYVFELLKREDPSRANELHPNDLKRVIRALEIIEINRNKIETNENDTKIDENKIKNDKKSLKNNEKIKNNQEENINYLIFGLNMPRDQLYENINKRVESMFEQGLIKEVKTLLKNGIQKEAQSMQGIGYKEVIEGFDGNLSEEEIKELIQRRTRNYAKRQLTFMRGMKDLVWIDTQTDAINQILNIIKEKIL
jgi:tRNA dimethylallyltransferase